MRLVIHYQVNADSDHCDEYEELKAIIFKVEFEETEIDYSKGSHFTLKIWYHSKDEDPVYISGEKLLYFFTGPEQEPRDRKWMAKQRKCAEAARNAKAQKRATMKAIDTEFVNVHNIRFKSTITQIGNLTGSRSSNIKNSQRWIFDKETDSAVPNEWKIEVTPKSVLWNYQSVKEINVHHIDQTLDAIKSQIPYAFLIRKGFAFEDLSAAIIQNPDIVFLMNYHKQI